MNRHASPKSIHVAIACGGTGGHLFPGLAVARRLQNMGASVLLILSEKKVDRIFVEKEFGLNVLHLPAEGLRIQAPFGFISSLLKSLTRARRALTEFRPHAVLGMGGFVTVAPFFAGKTLGARLFLHEANTVPGRSVRFLARMADRVYCGFEQTMASFPSRKALHTGMPVRWETKGNIQDRARATRKLGLDPSSPTLLVVGGSQGARSINRALCRFIGAVHYAIPGLQFIHLTGEQDFLDVREAYRSAGVKSFVQAFHHEMDILYQASDAAVSRAGASTIAELRFFNVPGILIPYPRATGDHQRHNALAAAQNGRFFCLDESDLKCETLIACLEKALDSAVQDARPAHGPMRAEGLDPATRIATDLLGALTIPAHAGPPDLDGRRVAHAGGSVAGLQGWDTH